MTDRESAARAAALPGEIVEVIRRVVDASGLDFTNGRSEVERELVRYCTIHNLSRRKMQMKSSLWMNRCLA